MRKINLDENVCWKQIERELCEFSIANMQIKSIYVSQELFDLLSQKFLRITEKYRNCTLQNITTPNSTKYTYDEFVFPEYTHQSIKLRLFNKFKDNEYEYGF